MKFRLLKEEDLEQVYDVMISTGYSRFFKGEENIKEIHKKYFGHDDVIVIVGEFAGKVVCYSIIVPYMEYREKFYPSDENYSFNLGVGVHKDQQGRGIGKKYKYLLNTLLRKKNIKECMQMCMKVIWHQNYYTENSDMLMS